MTKLITMLRKCYLCIKEKEQYAGNELDLYDGFMGPCRQLGIEVPAYKTRHNRISMFNLKTLLTREILL